MDEFDPNTLNFNVEVAANGFVMTTYVPEGNKSLKKKVISVHLSKSKLFEAISTHLENTA